MNWVADERLNCIPPGSRIVLTVSHISRDNIKVLKEPKVWLFAENLEVRTLKAFKGKSLPNLQLSCLLSASPLQSKL